MAAEGGDGGSGEGRRRWDSLVPDLLAVAFSRLDMDGLLAVQLVCKAWRAAALQPLCWDSLHLELQEKFLDVFIKDGEEERDALCGCDRKRLNQRAWSIVRCSGERAKSLYLHSVSSDKTVRAVVQRCPFVESLAFEDCHALSEATLLNLARSCTRLRLLSLSSCDGAITTAFIRELGLSCPGLIGLKLCDVSVPDDAAAAIPGSLPGLRYLSLSRTDISQDGALGILDTCADLEYVDTRCCPALDAYEVARLDVKVGGRVKEVRCDMSIDEALEAEWGWGFGF